MMSDNASQSAKRPSCPPLGVVDAVPYTLDDQGRKQVTNACPHGKYDLATLDALCAALGSAISAYRSLRVMAGVSGLSQTRKELDTLIKGAKLLVPVLQQLNGNTAHWLHQWEISAEDTLNLWGFLTYLSDAAQAIKSELTKAPHKPIDYPRRYLALDIATAVHDCLHITPTTTEDSPYHALLHVALHLATDHEPEAVHELARQGVTAWKERHGLQVVYPPAKPPDS
jgi:hypothetical protein